MSRFSQLSQFSLSRTMVDKKTNHIVSASFFRRKTARVGQTVCRCASDVDHLMTRRRTRAVQCVLRSETLKNALFLLKYDAFKKIKCIMFLTYHRFPKGGSHNKLSKLKKEIKNKFVTKL